MDSKPYVRLSATQGTTGPAQACNPPERALSSSSSFSGSLPIRAPPTPDDDDDDSDFDSNGHKLSGTSSNSCDISVGCESGSESEAFVRGDEFETASERPLVADPDGDAFQESGFVERYELSWPFVANPDEYEPVVENVLVGDPITDRVMPIAQLSWESDDNDVVGDDEVVSEVEDGEFLGPIKVPGNGFVEKHSNAPRVKVFEDEEGEEEEEEEESVKWKESLVVKQYEPAIGVKGVEGSDLDNFVEGQNGDSVEAEWIEGNGLATAETNEPNSVELVSNVLEGGEKAKYVAEESFVHCSNSKRNGGNISGSFEKLERGIHSGIQLRVEGNENQMMDFTVYAQRNPNQETVYLESCDLSEVTKGNKSESALCSDFLKSITLSSVSVTLLGENVATGLKIDDQIAIGKHLVSAGNAGITAVQFQGDTAYGANVEAPFKEDFPIEQEQEQTYLGLHLEKISAAPKVMIFEVEEGEECKPATGKESLVIKQSEPALEVKDVDGSELNSFVKGKNGDSIQAERIEDDGLGAAEFNEEINEPNSVELNINEWGGGEKTQYMAEESIMHCLNSKRNGVDISGSFGTHEKGIHSGIDFGVEGNGNQMMDSTTYSQPDPIQETLYLGNGDLSEAAEGDKYEYALYTDFLELITPSSDVAHEHIFRDDTKVKNFKINRTTTGVTVTILGDNVATGLKIEVQIAIGKHLVLAGSARAVQFEGDTAYGAKMEVRLKENFTTRQNRTSLGLSLMKLSGGLVLTTDILSLFSVGSSKMAVHVVLNDKQRGHIAIRTSSSDKLQSALVGFNCSFNLWDFLSKIWCSKVNILGLLFPFAVGC